MGSKTGWQAFDSNANESSRRFEATKTGRGEQRSFAYGRKASTTRAASTIWAEALRIFYRTSRGQFTPKGSSPKLTTHPTLTTNVKFMNLYPFNDIETISPRPLLFITGDVAHAREFSEAAYKLAAEPKELVILPGPVT